jgi:predicted acyltransferase
MKSNIVQERFTALDIFRGMTICFMIIVNTPGNEATTFWPLLHAHWNGFTPTDLVFPSFLFAVGNALSFVSKKWEILPQQEVLWKIGKRTVLIFLAGYLMYWFPFFKLDGQLHIISYPISQTRIMGVLQRIALCYGIVALMIYFFGQKKTVLIGVVSLFAYWMILLFFGTPGAEFTFTGNAGMHLDIWAFGANHLYHGEGFPFDPEGILSTLPALFNVIGGYVLGNYLQQKGKSYEALTKILLAGVALLFLAYCWNDFFPVNKKLWSSSYSVLTVGLDCIILSGIVYFTDIVGIKKGTNFFIITGKNPLFIYLLSEIGANVMWKIHIGTEPLYSWLFGNVFSVAGAYTGSLLFAVWWLLVCWFASYLLDRQKIYIRL